MLTFFRLALCCADCSVHTSCQAQSLTSDMTTNKALSCCSQNFSFLCRKTAISKPLGFSGFHLCLHPRQSVRTSISDFDLSLYSIETPETLVQFANRSIFTLQSSACALTEVEFTFTTTQVQSTRVIISVKFICTTTSVQFARMHHLTRSQFPTLHRVIAIQKCYRLS